MRVKKLQPEVMEQVLRLAESIHVQGKDKYLLGQALLYLDERNRLLEEVYRRAEQYLRFGMDERELTALRLAVERMRDFEAQEADALAVSPRDGSG